MTGLSRTMDIFNLLTAGDTEDVPLIYVRVNPHAYSVGESYFDPKIEEVFKKLLFVLEDIKNGKYEDLAGLNLIYINYDVVNPSADSLFEKLSIFNTDESDPNREFALALCDCVLDVLF